MNLKTVLRVARRRWASLVLPFLLVVGLALALTLLTPKVYQAETETFVTARGGSDVSDMISGTTYTQGQMASYMELVTSEVVLGPVAANLESQTDSHALASRVDVEVIEGTAVMKITASGPTPEDAVRLTREVTYQFVDVVEKMETPSNAQTSNIEASIIRDAQLPTQPSSPVLTRNLALAALVGLVLGVMTAYLRERADPVVRSAEEIEEGSDYPILGRIPNTTKKDRQGGHQAGTPRVEAFNVLRTNLQFVQTADDASTVVVTSARAGEGKSTTVAQLAAAYDGTQQRVLILEADLRRPKVAEYLGLISSVGLTNVLVGAADLTDVLQPYGSGNVQFLGAGDIPPNPVELLDSPAMARLLERVADEFDLVLIDAPPLLPVTDAAILSRRAAGTIVVMGLGVTERGDLLRAAASLETVEAHVVGIVINRIPSTEAAGAYTYTPTREALPAADTAATIAKDAA